MPAPSPPRRVLRFAAFEVEVRAGEVRKHGVRIKLQDQPFRLLQILLEHRGEVVTREELQRQIWPADTFVDFDRGLNNAVKRLREALGDSAETPRYVETLSKRGYRFIAPVNRQLSNGDSAASDRGSVFVTPAPTRSLFRVVMIAAVVLVLAFATMLAV